MTHTLNIAAPFTGTAVAMLHVPDGVFAQGIVGPCLSIEPLDGVDEVAVHAPVNGVVTAVFPHAFSIDAGDDQNVLVHLGIDTVLLKGEGFELHTSVGQEVSTGDLLITWRPSVARAAGYSVISPVVAVQAVEGTFTGVVAPGSVVTQGDAFIEWTSN